MSAEWQVLSTRVRVDVGPVHPLQVRLRTRQVRANPMSGLEVRGEENASRPVLSHMHGWMFRRSTAEVLSAKSDMVPQQWRLYQLQVYRWQEELSNRVLCSQSLHQSSEKPWSLLLELWASQCNMWGEVSRLEVWIRLCHGPVWLWHL